jgi:hypothetical protein
MLAKADAGIRYARQLHQSQRVANNLQRNIMVKFTASIERNEAQGDDPLMQFVMCMLHSRTNAHLQHWMTASRSDHTALSLYYDGIVDLLDTFVESFQGQYGKLHDVMDGYVFPAIKPLDYFLYLANEIDTLRKQIGFPQDSWLQNIVDEMRALVSDMVRCGP